MKRLTLIFVLFLFVPLAAHADNAGSGEQCIPGVPNACFTGLTCDPILKVCVPSQSQNPPQQSAPQTCVPNSIQTGGSCTLCAQSCISGDTCGLDGTCDALSGQFQTQPGASQPVAPVQPGASQPAVTGASGPTSLFNPLGTGSNLSTLLQAILAFVIKLGTVVVVLMLTYVGFLFVTARGEPGKITEARQALTWTIVGALILLGAQVIASGIQATAQALSTGS